MRGVTRRSFLAAGAAVALRAQAAAPLRLGFSLYAMQDFRPGDAVEIVGRIGYQAIEIVLLDDYPTAPAKFSAGDRAQLAYQLRDLDLTLAAMMDNLLLTADDATHAANLERIKAAAEVGRALSPQAPPPLETILGGRPDDWERLKESMAERLDDWARVARELDQTIALKAHVNSAVNTPERLLWLLRQARTPQLRAAYDYSHFQLAGLTIEGTTRDLAPEIAFVHVKDAAGTAAEPKFLLPGDGETDYALLFESLRTHGYAGPVVVEVSKQLQRLDDYHPIGAADQSYEALAPLLGLE